MPGEWETYFLMVGSSAAALIGLLFVVVTLAGEAATREPAQPADPAVERGARTFVSPTVFHFSVIVVICAVALIPHFSPHAMAAVAAIAGLFGLAYTAVVLSRLLGRRINVPHWTDPIYYGALPAIVYLWIVLSCIFVWSGSERGAYGIAIGTLGLLLVGIRDAWDLATWLTFHRQR
jgi:hypothetical protein